MVQVFVFWYNTINEISKSKFYPMFLIVLQRIIIEALLDLFYFPVWWFSFGIKRAILWCVEVFKTGNEWLAPGLWFANIAVPMYGQYDWQGRIISFFMRLVQIIFRLIGLTVWLMFCLVLFIVWILWPIVIVSGMYKALF